jgi:hypothetical protein
MQLHLDRPDIRQDLIHQPSSRILVLHLLLLQGLEMLGDDGIDGELLTEITDYLT